MARNTQLTRISRALAQHTDKTRTGILRRVAMASEAGEPYRAGMGEDSLRSYHLITAPHREVSQAGLDNSIRPQDARRMLNDYRQNRDAGTAGDAVQMYGSQKDIRQAYIARNWHG
jgi:hypothetical protein